MKFLLPFLLISVETGLVFGSPYEKNGMIYDGRPVLRKARHEVRDVQADASVLMAVASMLTILRGPLSFADQV